MKSRALLFRAASTAAWAALVASTQLTAAADRPQVTVLSSRPELVTGGDALVRIDLPPGDSRVRVALNGRDVTPAFVPGGGARRLIGLVTGLTLGENALVAAIPGVANSATTLVNYPIAGPVISGPHERPFICDTATSPVLVLRQTMSLLPSPL